MRQEYRTDDTDDEGGRRSGKVVRDGQIIGLDQWIQVLIEYSVKEYLVIEVD